MTSQLLFQRYPQKGLQHPYISGPMATTTSPVGLKLTPVTVIKVSTHVRVTTYVGLLLFIFFSGPAISVVLALSFLSVLALKFNTGVELYYTQSSIMVAPGALLQLEESFRFRWEVVPNSGIVWRRQLKEWDSQQILIFAQRIHANDELSCTLSEASHANRTCC